MTTLFLKLTAIVFLISVLLTSCRKDILEGPQPIPSKPTEFGIVKFVVDTNLATGNYDNSNLAAVVTIVNDKNIEVVKEKALLLEFRNKVTVESFQLPVGNYKLTGFRLVYRGVNTHFAVPKANSVKAGLVEKPLAMDLKVDKNGAGEVVVKVVRVGKEDTSEMFGYPPGTFNNNDTDTDPYIKVKVRAAIKIGDVMYDSLPGTLNIRTYNDKGEMTFNSVTLKAGTDEVPLIKLAVRYEIGLTKWGSDYSLNLKREEINEEAVYIIGGSKAAKKLKSETLYELVNGNYKAKSKAEYIYDGNGNVAQVKHYLKGSDNTPYLAAIDKFEYRGERVIKITNLNEKGFIIGVSSFDYNNEGKVSRIYNKENQQETIGTIEYYSQTGEVKINHEFPGQIYNKNYYQRFIKGNMFESAYISNFDHNELGRYDHDNQINPYVHLNMPDLFLSNSNINNVINQSISYPGGYRSFIANYTYYDDGYPKELIKKSTSGPTPYQSSTTKTVFTY